MIQLILVILAIIIFFVYNAVFIATHEVPKSLSDTFYYYQDDKKGLGYIFTAMMFSVCFTLLPAWLSISDSFTTWEHYFTFLAFFAAGSIAFVGAAPAFRNVGIENTVHMVAAKSAAIFSLLWCAIVCWRIMYIIPIGLGITWLIGYIYANIRCKKIYKQFNLEKDVMKHNIRAYLKYIDVYIWEMAAFVITFVTILVQSIINLF